MTEAIKAVLCSKSAGFTLVELIIVIIIIGVLAALAIPRFVSSTRDAQEATLAGDLMVIRNAINLYYHQHDSTYPGALKEDGSGGVAAEGDNPGALIHQLTQYTNAAGKTSETLDRENFPFGPYLIRGIPENPVAASGTDADGVCVTADTEALFPDDIEMSGDYLMGWKYSTMTGEFIANCTEYVDW
jgi:prepilin-type N-terminal cleavage/methylation domain-containing protein